MYSIEDDLGSDQFLDPDDNENNEPARPASAFITDDRGNSLSALANELMRDLPTELHFYKPMVISLVRKIVPPAQQRAGISDASCFLVEAWRNCKDKTTFPAYAKQCVFGKLQNEYVRTQKVSEGRREEWEIERIKNNEKQAEIFQRYFLAALIRRPDLAAKIAETTKGLSVRRQKQNLMNELVDARFLLPTEELHLTTLLAGGTLAKTIAAELGVSPASITQRQQKSFEKIIDNWVRLLTGTPPLEIARESAEVDVKHCAEYPLLSPQRKAHKQKQQTEYIVNKDTRRFCISNWTTRIYDNNKKQLAAWGLTPEGLQRESETAVRHRREAMKEQVRLGLISEPVGLDAIVNSHGYLTIADDRFEASWQDDINCSVDGS